MGVVFLSCPFQLLLKSRSLAHTNACQVQKIFSSMFSTRSYLFEDQSCSNIHFSFSVSPVQFQRIHLANKLVAPMFITSDILER